MILAWVEDLLSKTTIIKIINIIITIIIIVLLLLLMFYHALIKTMPKIFTEVIKCNIFCKIFTGGDKSVMIT